MLLTETADQTFLLQYVKDYCEALAENYRIYHKRTLQGNLSGNYPEYAREQLQAMEDGTANLMRFRMQEGKKYYKINSRRVLRCIRLLRYQSRLH